MSDTPRTDALRDSSGYPTPRGELWQFAATLERELVAMKSENDEFHKLLSEQQANWEKDLNAALRNSARELIADAMRYRWLKERLHGVDFIDDEVRMSGNLDLSIDAAIAQEQK